MNIKLRITIFLKSIGLIRKDKLEELELLSREIKKLIDEHNQSDPLNPDSRLNGTLYVYMEAVLHTIGQIKKNNPNLDWNK